MKVLIAEDDRITRLRIETHLAEWGHEPVACADGAEAWERFQRELCPLVISDWQMPVMDGLELIRRIRASAPEGAYVYCILLTARAEKHDVVEGMEAGADDFVTKPFDKEELRVRVRAGERVIELEQTLGHRNEQLEAANARITSANRRMTDDLEAAAKIQQAFLPQQLPELPGLSLAWNLTPCDELAGDMFNIHWLDDDHAGLWVADVAGHGVAAALLAVTLSRILSHLSGPDAALVRRVEGSGECQPVPPAEVAEHLNRRFPWDPDAMQFFTFLYGLLNVKTRELRYVSAGHPGPVYVPEERDATILPMTPPAVGIILEAEFVEQRVVLSPGDRLYLYTDGITEAACAGGEQFGGERLARTLGEYRCVTLTESVERLVADVSAWADAAKPTDDLSVVAIEIA